MTFLYGVNLDIANGDVRNGVGKTTIIDAINFALFGKVTRNVNKSSLPNWIKKKNCLITLDFMINNNSYHIDAGIKPNVLTLLENGKDITKPKMDDTYDHISKNILGSSFLVFNNSVILSNGGSGCLFTMTKSEKRELVEKLFNVEVYGKLYELVKSESNTFNKEIISIRDKINLISNTINDLESKLSTYDDNRKRKFLDYKNKIVTIKTWLDEHPVTDSSSLATERLQLQAELQTITDGREKFLDASRKLSTKIGQIETQIQNEQRIISKYKEVMDNVCEPCNKNLTDILKYDPNSVVTLDDSKASLLEKLDIINNRLKTFNLSSNELTNKIKALDTAINNAKVVDTSRKMMEDSLKTLADDVRKFKDETNPFADMLSNNQKQIEKFQKDYEKHGDTHKYLQYLVEVFSEKGIRNHIISNLVDVLNELIKKYLQQFGANYTCVVDGNFNFTFLSIGGECEYGNFSDGEKKRNNLALMFSLRELLGSQKLLTANILFIDELIDGGIDQYAVNAILKYIRNNICNQGISCYIVSHRESIAGCEFDNEIKLVKQNGFTRME
jgi:exonuclease SbcC